jgi:YfiR/HmsC-like
MIRTKHIVAGFMAALLLVLPAHGGVSEYELKAALIFKISKFVRWPSAAEKPLPATLRLCVVGRDYFGAAIDGLNGQTVQGQPIQVARPSAGELASASCQIVFISRSEADHYPSLLKSTAGKPVLTVSDIEGFAASGGTVEFATKEKKLGFRINPESGRRAGLEFSAQLLQLATIVKKNGAP